MDRLTKDDTTYRILRALRSGDNVSQRDIARSVGMSLGAVNKGLRVLQDLGLVDVHNFHAADNKPRCMYLLTSAGAKAWRAMGDAFVKRRLAESEALQAEIAAVSRELIEE